MAQTISPKGAVRLAGAFAACAIGSGFATGQEILQFFTGYGIDGVRGAVITTGIMSWLGSRFMKHGYVHHTETPEQVLTCYFGEKAGKWLGAPVQIFLYSVFIVMIAGAGATLSEAFGLPPIMGRSLMAGLTLGTVVSGLRKAAGILGSLGAVIIAFSLFTGLFGFFRNPGNIAHVPVPELPVCPGGWLWSAILYPGYNAVIAVFLSCCLGSTAKSEREASLGGALGGIFFGLAVLCMDLGLLANVGRVFYKAVPTLTLAEEIAPLFAALFSVVIFCGTYTTAVPMLWGVVRHFAGENGKRAALLAVGLTAVGLMLGMTDFKTLVNVVYPFSGYGGVLLMIAVAVREVRDKRENLI